MLEKVYSEEHALSKYPNPKIPRANNTYPRNPAAALTPPHFANFLALSFTLILSHVNNNTRVGSILKISKKFILLCHAELWS